MGAGRLGEPSRGWRTEQRRGTSSGNHCPQRDTGRPERGDQQQQRQSTANQASIAVFIAGFAQGKKYTANSQARMWLVSTNPNGESLFAVSGQHSDSRLRPISLQNTQLSLRILRGSRTPRFQTPRMRQSSYDGVGCVSTVHIPLDT
jgi:hypothetical protein